MKANKLWGALLATTFGLAAMMAPSSADAQKKKAEPAAVAPTGPAMTTKPIKIEPAIAGLKWGMTIKEVHKAIDTLIDDDFKEDYKKVQPGVKMKELDARVAEEKATFKRSRIDFGRLPVALDSTPLRGEYTYQNKESMLTLTRKGQTRYFFFIQDRLWKIIDEIALGEKSPYGKTLQDAAVKVTAQYGAVGRVIPPNPDKQIYVTTVDWKDDATHLVLIERHETAIALKYEDNATLANIDTLRANKQQQEDDVDPAVRAAARGEDKQPEPPPPPAEKKKK